MTCENARFNCWFFSTPEVCGPVRICGDRICVATCLLSHPFPNGRIACRRARYQGHNRESQNVSTQDKDSCLAFSPGVGIVLPAPGTYLLSSTILPYKGLRFS